MKDPFADLRDCLDYLRTVAGRRRNPEVEGQYFTLQNGRSFLEDTTRLLISKAFRRMHAKTQVVVDKSNPHIRNRMTHTAEVVACSMQIAEILGLNTDLAEAIAIGHDMGHMPFGHMTEHYVQRAMKSKFTHEVFGVVIAQHIEHHGMGLNLTYEVLEGIYRHSGKNAINGMTPEAWVVRYADKIAYIFADFNDIQRLGYPMPAKIEKAMRRFGEHQRERVYNTVIGLCRESKEMGRVSFQYSGVAKEFDELRCMMYEVYPKVTIQRPDRMLEPIIEFLEGLDMGDPCLLLALMTDSDVERLSSIKVLDFNHVKNTALGEILDSIKDKGIDPCNLDLSW